MRRAFAALRVHVDVRLWQPDLLVYLLPEPMIANVLKCFQSMQARPTAAVSTASAISRVPSASAASAVALLVANLEKRRPLSSKNCLLLLSTVLLRQHVHFWH